MKFNTLKPVVFVSVFEHNSNLLPWRELGSTLIVIPLTQDGYFNYEALEMELEKIHQMEYESVLFLQVQICQEISSMLTRFPISFISITFSLSLITHVLGLM
jgi:selenocysteine lyase/cysteine desulfurase